MTTLDHDLPEDRAALIAALRAEGLDAVAYGTGGGNHHVAVAIAENVSIATASDERETIAVASVDEDDRDAVNHVPKSHLVRIIRPRVEEILELVRDRLRNAGYGTEAGRRIVLTGGGAQLTGLPELARTLLAKQVRIGRPLGVQGLPEAAKGPSFAAPVGLLVYPQVAGLEHFVPRPSASFLGTGTDGYLSRMGRWIKDSF